MKFLPESFQEAAALDEEMVASGSPQLGHRPQLTALTVCKGAGGVY
jgi:hypothetical protein